MATKTDTRGDGDVATQTAPTTGFTEAVNAPSPPQPLFNAPIVLKLERTRTGKKKKKKKYTRGTQNLQQFVLGVTEAASRTSNSLTKGLRTFVKRSKRSQRRRRDGLLRDSLRNASRGLSEGFTELGKAPGDIARRISTRRVWRTVRIFTPGAR